MASKINNYDDEEVIVLEVREVVGEIHSSIHGQHPMVVEAFLMAGQYIDNLAKDGEVEAKKIEFNYHGVSFVASFERE